jgi:hypothetical protein
MQLAFDLREKESMILLFIWAQPPQAAVGLSGVPLSLHCDAAKLLTQRLRRPSNPLRKIENPLKSTVRRDCRLGFTTKPRS